MKIVFCLQLATFVFTCLYSCGYVASTRDSLLGRTALQYFRSFRYAPNHRTISNSVSSYENKNVLNVGNEGQPEETFIAQSRVDGLISILNENTDFEEINLAGIGLTDDAFAILSDGLAKQSNLKELNLNWNRLTASSNENILKVLDGKPMEKIQLAGCTVVDETAVHGFSQILRQYPNLKVLDLRHNYIGSMGARMIADSLKKSCHQVEKLSFAHNPINDYGITAISKALPSLPHLTGLDLQGTRMTFDSAFDVSMTFRELPQLKYLLISNNPLGDKGTLAIMEQLPKLASLHWLDVRDIGMTDWSAREFVELLPKCANLKHMHFDHNKGLSSHGMNLLYTLMKQQGIAEI